MSETGTTNGTAEWILAAKRIFGDELAVQSEADRTVTFPGGEARIRHWDAPATVERVTAIRSLLRRVPAGSGIPTPIGDDDAVVMIGGRIYDAVTVTGGLPLNRHGLFAVPGRGEVAIPLHETADHGDMLVEAAQVLAKVHSATREQPQLAELGATSALDLHVGAKARWQEARKRLGSHAESLQEVRRWLRCGNRVIPIAADRLRAAGDVAFGSPVLIHGDVWPAFLMVDEPSTPRQLKAVAGWSSASAGSAVLDLAQLSVRTTGWSEATVESVLGAYSDHAELLPAARRIVPVVAAVDLLDQLGHLLEIAYLDDTIVNHPAQPFIRGGIKVLLRSLEQLTNVLAPPEPETRRSFGPRSARSADRPPSRGARKQAAGQSRRRSSGRKRREG